MSNPFFTSDTHFYHTGALRFRPGLFESVEHMNDVMITNWNSVVGKGDRVYHMGDFGWPGEDGLKKIIKRLNGQIHLVLGNHDRLHSSDHKLFASIKQHNYIKIYDQKIFLHHYACRVWRGSHRGSWHLYGHSHGSLPGHGLSFDVGVDAWNYFPLSFEQVKAEMDKREVSLDDYHVYKEGRRAPTKLNP